MTTRLRLKLFGSVVVTFLKIVILNAIHNHYVSEIGSLSIVKEECF
jgi:hypothetical protein